MCTLAAKKINNSFIIFKTRDLDYRAKTRVIKEKGKLKKLLVVDQRKHCEGLNEKGIGFIEATLTPYPYKKHIDIQYFGRKMLDQSTILGAINIIKKVDTSVNIIIADAKNAYIVEKTPYEFAVTKIKNQGVITNTSIKLSKQNGSRLPRVKESALLRYKRAKELIGKVNNLKDAENFLRDKKKGWPADSICRGYPWWISTRCAFIYDLKNKRIFFCSNRPDRGKFREYKL